MGGGAGRRPEAQGRERAEVWDVLGQVTGARRKGPRKAGDDPRVKGVRRRGQRSRCLLAHQLCT